VVSVTAREEWDAAMRRHPSAVRESELTFTTTDEDRFNDLFTAESQRFPHQNLPPEWQDWADDLTPDGHPIPDAWALVLILFLGIVVPWVIVIAAVRWAVR